MSSSAPPIPSASLRGCCITASSRGSTWPSTGASRARISLRPAGMAMTTKTMTTRAAMTKYTQFGGWSEWASLPVIAANTMSSRMCRTKATTWERPTLAAATAAGILLRWR